MFVVNAAEVLLIFFELGRHIRKETGEKPYTCDIYKKCIRANRKLPCRDAYTPEKNSIFVKYALCVFRVVRILPDTDIRIQRESRERVKVFYTAKLTMYVLIQ